MQHKIAIIGLGYVGLPLAVEFAKKYPVIGFDINQKRIEELSSGKDSTLEIAESHLQSVLTNKAPQEGAGLFVTNAVEYLKSCNTYIVTVPTPTDKNHRPV